MRKTAVAVCLLLCLGIAHARLSAAPADEGNKKCNKECADAYRRLTGKTPINTRSQVQDKKDDKGNDNKGNDNKGNDNQENEKKFCAGRSCSGCATAMDYAAVCDAVRCTGRPTTQEALNALTKRSDITWDSCRFVRVGSECKSKCEDSCRAAGCSATTYRVACVQNTATKKAEWAKVITPTTQAVCTPLPTPPLRTCSGAPPGSVTRSGVTTAYAWPAACKDLAAATPSSTCTGAASCPSSAVSSATATCPDQDVNQAPAWVVTDACPAPIPTPQLCTVVPVLANTTFASGCASTIGTVCPATGCASGFTPVPSLPFATCTNNGWTFNGACVGPAALKLELVGSSPVASGATITIKATLTQANFDVGGRTVTIQGTSGSNVDPTNGLPPLFCLAPPSTNASGVTLINCTVGQLTTFALSQVAPLTASVTVAVGAVPAFGAAVIQTLTVPVQVALCGTFSSPGTVNYVEGFELNTATNMAGSSWGRVNNAAAAFQGGSYASITAGTAGTQWLQGGPSLFPAAGKLVTQVAIYLDPSTGWSINGQAFSYSVALNNIASFGTGVFRDYIFSIGWYDAATSALGSKAFWVAASDFTVSDPKNFPSGSNRNSIPITQPGWYYLQHAFVPKTCPPNIGYGSTAKCIYAQMKVFKASVGASCGSVVATQSGSATASWEVGPRGKGFSGTPSDQVEDIAGPRYGYFNMPATSSLSVDYFYYVAFSS